MNKLMMAAIGMVVCSMVTGCVSSATSKGGTYANLPDPKPDEYVIHWENEDEAITADATVYRILGFFYFGNQTWMLRDAESYNIFGIRNFSQEARARNAALFNACQQKKCDALIGATYDIDIMDWLIFSEAKCKVTGWPANITGIEKVANKAK